MRTFDLVVIGAGPGGYVAAIRAAQLGLRVAVVERDRPGGVCVNWGCIPSKAILKSAGLYQEMKEAAAYGIVVKGLSVDYREVIRRSRKVAERMSKGVGFLFRKNNRADRGDAVVTSPTTVRAGDEEIGAKDPGRRGDGGAGASGHRAGREDGPFERRCPRPGGDAGIGRRPGRRRGGRRVRLRLPYLRRRRDGRGNGRPAPPAHGPGGGEGTGEGAPETGDPGAHLRPGKAAGRGGGGAVVSTGGKEERLSAEAFLVAVGRKPLTEGLAWRNAA